MADKKISALTAATTPLAGTEVLPIVQSSTTKKVSVADLTKGRTIQTTGINDNNNNEVITITTTASAVNELTVANAATGANPVISATGTDTNIGITLTPKGTGNAVLTSGNLVVANGNGIDFSATSQAGGMTSEVFSDYEEGTWTATLKGSVSDPTTPVTATGRYTRVGRLVTITAAFSGVNTTGASGDVSVSGIPFNNSTPHTRTTGNVGALYNFTIANKYITCGMDENATSVYFQDEASGTSGAALQHSAGPTRYIRFALTYYAA